MKKILITGILLAVSFAGFAQDVDKLVSKEYVTKVIKTLSADDMQGRGTFTPGIEKAAQFIEGEYKAIGLKPMDGSTGYRQNFTMIRTTPLSSAVSVNGTVIAPEKVAIISATSFNWSKPENAQISKITADMDFAKEYRSFFGKGNGQIVFVDPKFEEFFKRLQRYTRSRTAFKDAAPTPPVVFILGNYDAVNSFNIVNQVKSEELPLFNIAGVIPGKSKPNEYVVFSGHYDHLGILKGAEVMQGDSIANGADDDASGTTAVITLAKYFKKLNNNERTLIFVAFTAEEIGEYGSAYFAKTVDPDKVVAMFNIEMIGKPSKWGTNSAFITGFERSNFGTILQNNLTQTKFKFYPDPYPNQNLFYRSDNASLAEVGVPAHTISTDQIDSDKLYHTVKDELSSLDVDNITATIKAIALSSRTIVSGQDTPTRVPKVK